MNRMNWPIGVLLPIHVFLVTEINQTIVVQSRCIHHHLLSSFLVWWLLLGAARNSILLVINFFIRFICKPIRDGILHDLLHFVVRGRQADAITERRIPANPQHPPRPHNRPVDRHLTERPATDNASYYRSAARLADIATHYRSAIRVIDNIAHYRSSTRSKQSSVDFVDTLKSWSTFCIRLVAYTTKNRGARKLSEYSAGMFR